MQTLKKYVVPAGCSLGLKVVLPDGRPDPHPRGEVRQWDVRLGHTTTGEDFVWAWAQGTLNVSGIWDDPSAIWLAVEYPTAQERFAVTGVYVPAARIVAIGDRAKICKFISKHTPPEKRGRWFFEKRNTPYQEFATVGDGGFAAAKLRAEAGDFGTAHTRTMGKAIAGLRGLAIAGYMGTAHAGIEGIAEASDGGFAYVGARGTAKAGDGGFARADIGGRAFAGVGGSAIVGDAGQAVALFRGIAYAGDCGSATTGDCGMGTAGDYGTVQVGMKSWAQVGANGTVIAGPESLVMAGEGSKVRAGLGSEIRFEGEDLKTHIFRVGENGVEPDIFYCLTEEGILSQVSS